jgi:hypothetical protein
MPSMDAPLGLGVGVALSTAAGLRVFVPLLHTSLAARTGWLTLTPGMAWIGSDTAVIAFAMALVLHARSAQGALPEGVDVVVVGLGRGDEIPLSGAPHDGASGCPPQLQSPSRRAPSRARWRRGLESDRFLRRPSQNDIDAPTAADVAPGPR